MMNNTFERHEFIREQRRTRRNKESRPKVEIPGFEIRPVGGVQFDNNPRFAGQGKVGVKSRSLMVVIPPRPSLGMTLIMQHIEIGFATGTRGQSHRDLT